MPGEKAEGASVVERACESESRCLNVVCHEGEEADTMKISGTED